MCIDFVKVQRIFCKIGIHKVRELFCKITVHGLWVDFTKVLRFCLAKFTSQLGYLHYVSNFRFILCRDISNHDQPYKKYLHYEINSKIHCQTLNLTWGVIKISKLFKRTLKSLNLLIHVRSLLG